MAVKRPLTDEQKFELEVMTDLELGRLQRTYLIMAKERAGSKPTKQELVMDILRKEITNLNVDLTVATAPGKKRIDVELSKAIVEGLDEYDATFNTINLRKKQLREINISIKTMEKQKIWLKKNLPSEFKITETILQSQKTLCALENKLEVHMKKFCAICFHNSKLRAEVDHLLKERAVFNKIWNSLISKLCMGKRFMMDLVEQANMAYDQREESLSKLQALREKAMSDYAKDMMEMRELSRKEDDTLKVKDFYAVKNQCRIMIDLMNLEMEKREEEREKLETKLSEYQQILTNVFKFTRSKDLPEIISKFRTDEMENFAKFKFINETVGDMEELNGKLGILHLEIDEQKALDEVRINQQQANLEKYRKEFEEAKKNSDTVQKKLTSVSDSLSKVMTGVRQLFDLCQCSRDPLTKLLGNQNNLNVYNILLYMQIIEAQLSSKLISVYNKEKHLAERKMIKPASRLLKTERLGRPKLYTIEQIIPSNPCPLCVEHEQVSDVIDTLQRVLNRDEVKVKLKARLALPDGLARIHNVSACHLPKSREIIQKRYQ